MRIINNQLAIYGNIWVDISAIVRVEASGSYNKVFITGGRKFLVSYPLKRIEELLPKEDFVRIHKSHIVNKACIQRISAKKLEVTLTNGVEVPISRRRLADFIAGLW